MAKEVLVTAEKINRRKKTRKLARILSLIILLFLTVVFIILSLIYKGGKFVITLDPNSQLDNSIVIYDSKDIREATRRLYAEEMPFMDNISIKWLPENIDTEKDGSHNGQNYIAYTFYIENTGKKTVNYWYEVVIDDVIKRVDEAIRIMIFVDGDKTVYAKLNGITNQPEDGTTPFYQGEKLTKENIAVLEERKKFTPGDVDRITVVVWLEGDDPDCVNAIIGGEIKMHMNIREEHYDPNKDDVEDIKEDQNKDVEEQKLEEQKEEKETTIENEQEEKKDEE